MLTMAIPDVEVSALRLQYGDFASHVCLVRGHIL